MKCGFCNQDLGLPKIRKRFCSPLCQRKHYVRRPEIREKYRLRIKEYRRTHPEWREKHRILQATYKEKRQAYWKEYGKRPEVRARIREKERWRLKNDPQYAIADRLRRSLRHALTKYSKTGKTMRSKKYGLKFAEIFEKLKPFPQNLSDYDIDHIIPLRIFDLNNIEQVKRAFAPNNLQWLTMRENRKKSGKYPFDKLKQVVKENL